MVRRAFIAFGVTVFLVYCWASVAYQNRVDMPDYRLVEVDLLGGASRTEWDANPEIRFQRLMELEGMRYQMPAEASGSVDPERALTSDDFNGFIAGAPAGQPVRVRLRDASAFVELLSRNYLLRDAIFDPADPNGPPLYMGGVPLDRKMLDDLGQRGYRTLTVTGFGSPVTFQFGTAVMIAVIFLTLVAALKPMLWDPFMVMLEKRRLELEVGAEAERRNQIEAVRFEEERRRRNAGLFREKQELRLKGEGSVARQVGEIIKAAREEEKRVKMSGLDEIARSAKVARKMLDADIPGLAEAIADTLTPGNGGPRRGSMENGNG